MSPKTCLSLYIFHAYDEHVVDIFITSIPGRIGLRLMTSFWMIGAGCLASTWYWIRRFWDWIHMCLCFSVPTKDLAQSGSEPKEAAFASQSSNACRLFLNDYFLSPHFAWNEMIPLCSEILLIECSLCQ